MNNPVDASQVGHLARLAILGMCARGVASAAFADAPEVLTVVVTVSRPSPSFLADEYPVTLEYGGHDDVALYGASL